MIKRELGIITSLAKRINELDQEEGLVKAIDSVIPALETQIKVKKRVRDTNYVLER